MKYFLGVSVLPLFFGILVPLVINIDSGFSGQFRPYIIASSQLSLALSVIIP